MTKEELKYARELSCRLEAEPSEAIDEEAARIIRKLADEVDWLTPRHLMLVEHNKKTDEYVEALKAEVERLEPFEKADTDRKEEGKLEAEGPANYQSEAGLNELEKYRQERTRGHGRPERSS